MIRTGAEAWGRDVGAVTDSPSDRHHGYRFGNCFVDLERRLLFRDGEEVPLRPRSFEVLCHLVQNHGRLVSRDVLMQAMWGDTVVVDNSLNQCIAEIRRALADSDQAFIRTMPRQGYVFDAPAIRVVPSAVPAGRAPGSEPTGERRNGTAHGWRSRVLFGLVGAAIVTLIAWQSRPSGEKNDDPSVARTRTSIAVLPFSDLSPDGDSQYFADGLTEEIINSLAGIRDLQVISRASSFELRDPDLSAAEVARILGVEYLVEGSVRRDESTVRITARLVRAATDTRLWSDTFDQALRATEILRVQETIAHQIADRLRVRVIPGEFARINPPSSIAALDAYMDGRASIRELHSYTGDFSDAFFRAAIDKMEASIREDPDWAPSQAALGLLWHWWMSSNRHVNFDERWQRSYEHIQSALGIDPEYEPAWASLAFLHLERRDFGKALDAIEHVSDSTAFGVIVKAYLMQDMAHYDAAIEYYDKALALDPMSVLFRMQRAQLLMCAGRHEETIREFEAYMAMTADLGERDWGALFYLAYAYAKLGNRDKVLELLAEWAEFGGPKTEMAPVYAIVGMTDIAVALLTEAEESGELRIRPIVPTAAAIGQTDRAWAQLARIAEEEPGRLGRFPCFEESQLLKSDPRYPELRAIAGIPEEYR